MHFRMFRATKNNMQVTSCRHRILHGVLVVASAVASSADERHRPRSSSRHAIHILPHDRIHIAPRAEEPKSRRADDNSRPSSLPIFLHMYLPTELEQCHPWTSILALLMLRSDGLLGGVWALSASRNAHVLLLRLC